MQVEQQHRAALADLDICGRIYISSQGINAQFSGPAAHTHVYTSWVSKQPLFQVLHKLYSPNAHFSGEDGTTALCSRCQSQLIYFE